MTPAPLCHAPRPFPRLTSLLLAVLAVIIALPASAQPDSDLEARIESTLDSPTGEASLWGIYVRDLSSGEVLYERYSNMAFVPASNQKLITTSTALDALGSDYRYETTLHFNGTVDGSVLRGDLIIEGSGDPTFGSREVNGEDPLRTWARNLAEMGVTRIEGRIIGDNEVFEDEHYAEGWDVSHVPRQSYAQASCGLSYRDNLISVSIRGGQPGQLPEIDEDTPGYFTIENRATTSPRVRGRDIEIRRTLGSDTFDLTGAVTQGYRGSMDLPVADPTVYALHSFKRFLEEEGIDVDAEPTGISKLSEPPAYDETEELFTHFSPPLSEIVKAINKESNNLYAEQLFRTFGWGGSIDGASRRAGAFLTDIGIATRGLSIVDGSGLSRKDLITPEALGRVLAHMYDHEEYETFRNSLARGGERRTTLEYRLSNANVAAKTGSLQAVRTLSGYVTTEDGRDLAFVVMANNYTIPSSRIVRTIDDLVLAMAGAPSGAPTDQIAR